MGGYRRSTERPAPLGHVPPLNVRYRRFTTISGHCYRSHTLDVPVQVWLFLCCLICQLSADLFFLLNIFFGEAGSKVFRLEDLADLDFAFVFVAVGVALPVW